jgi:formylglycine-generating enzyme required for sulfatase activity
MRVIHAAARCVIGMVLLSMPALADAPKSEAPRAGDTKEVNLGLVDFTLSYAPAGTFELGSPKSDLERRPNEGQHTVTLTRGFYIGKTEVTQSLYTTVMGMNPSVNKGREGACGTCPVENILWYQAVDFCNRLSERLELEPAYTISGITVTLNEGANGYRLPTEAQWEYAARAGGTHIYSGSDDGDAVAWHFGNSGGKSQPVGTKAPNAWGIHDMSGNVWEWIWDNYGDYPKGAVVDPHGPAEGSWRVRRGGSFSQPPYWMRTALRARISPGNYDYGRGFRIVLPE